MASSVDGSFQEAIGSILVMAQCFGIMPVVGIKSNSTSNLKFQWKSSRTVYSFIAFLLTLIYAILTIGKTLSTTIEFDRTSRFAYFQYANNFLNFIQKIFIHAVNVVFYGSAVYGMYCFGALARKWPKLMQRWEEIEAILPMYRNTNEREKLSRHLKWLTFSVFMGSLGKTAMLRFIVF